MSKKLISIVLSCVLVLSLAIVGVIGVSAAVDSDERYVPSEGTKTNRLYFAMPESWKSAKFGADTAGAYWWGGTDACGSLDGASVGNAWPGYKIQVADADANLFFVDLPDDVPVVIFNNFLNGGERKTDEDGNVTYELGEEQFKAAKQTMDIQCQYVSDGDDDLYDNLLDGDFWSQAEETLNSSDKTFFGNFEDNFFMDPDFDTISFSYDNMVYVIDPTNVDVNAVSGKETYGGNFYFFYGPNEETGKYEYGELPNYEMAKENGLVKEIDKNATPDQPVKPDDPSVDPSNPNKPNTPDATNPSVNPTTPADDSTVETTVPAPAQDPTSSTTPATSDTPANNSGNNAVQTGATTAAAVLAVLLVAGGAVVYTRKRFE